MRPPCWHERADDVDDAVPPPWTRSSSVDDDDAGSSVPSADGDPCELPLRDRRSRLSTRTPDADDGASELPLEPPDDADESASLPPSRDDADDA